MTLLVLDLGRQPYKEVWDMQRALVEDRSTGVTEDTLILVEHESVITLGRKTTPENLGRDLPVPSRPGVSLDVAELVRVLYQLGHL